MFDGVVVARFGRLGGATLVDCLDTELVDDLLLQAVHLADGVGRFGFVALGPIRQELVLALDDVVRDGTSTVLLRGGPLELDKVHAVVIDGRFAGRFWGICYLFDFFWVEKNG